MNYFKYIYLCILGIFCIFSQSLLACPYCEGSINGANNFNVNYLIAIFIASINIIYFLIYRVIKKSNRMSAEVGEKVYDIDEK